ncbi:Uncharacterised protein [Bordetella pertussis]|nr:Uncharacterised protein [Bordetella pertussis]
MVAHRAVDARRQRRDAAQQLLDRLLAVQAGAFERGVQAVDVGLVMARMVYFHRACIDMRLERIVGIRKGRQDVWHAVSGICIW